VKSYRFHPAADAEYTAAVQYYTGISPELGVRFFEDIERLIATAREYPRQYLEFEPPMRRAIARQFPYALIYLDEPESLWIVAVMNLRRHPEYWKERLTV